MDFARFFPMVLGLAFSLPVLADDLTKVDRAIAKEPAYKTKSPKYCLLLFGPEATRKVWLVLDGDTLYVDRNGNGDLTEEGERLGVSKVENTEPDNPIGEVRRFYDLNPKVKYGMARRDAPTLPDTGRYTRFMVLQLLPKKDFRAKTEGHKEFLALMRHGLVEVQLLIDGKRGQQAKATFANRPEDAPILHFDGPLTPRIHPSTLHLVRGPQATELMVQLATLGPAKDTLVILENDSVPAGVPVVAEIEFPAKQPGREPTRTKVLLKERC